MNKYFRECIILCNGIFKGVLLKLFHMNCKVSLYAKISPFTELTVDRGYLEYGKLFILRSGSKIRVRNHARLIIGNKVGIGNRCFIISHNEITIGEGTIIGPNVLIYDHDHDYSSSNLQKTFVSNPVHIGKNVWIGANVVILRGTDIGDNCVVAAGCILKGNYKSGKIIYQKHETIQKDIK